ncbi:MAG: pro-sigmaK processing inhibitor BofA family protein [Clostridia bacterium]|nr:pro-sigmaK processing inhibitor BofA family protein [Clostridia bacterium]
MTIGLRLAVYAAVGVAILVVLVALLRSRKPLRFTACSLAEGMCALAAVDIVGIFTGLSLGFGWFSIASCATFGIPGVIAMLLMRAITLL